MSADKDMRVAVIARARTPFAKARADLREYSGDQGRSCGIAGQARGDLSSRAFHKATSGHKHPHAR